MEVSIFLFLSKMGIRVTRAKIYHSTNQTLGTWLKFGVLFFQVRVYSPHPPWKKTLKLPRATWETYCYSYFEQLCERLVEKNSDANGSAGRGVTGYGGGGCLQPEAQVYRSTWPERVKSQAVIPEGKTSVVTKNMARSSSMGAENGFRDVRGRDGYGRTTGPEVLSTAGFQVLNASWLVGELFALKGQGIGG